MPTNPSKGVPVWIIAIIAVAGTALILGSSVIFIYFMRKRRQRLRGITSIATGERRLSHYNRGRLTITDDDFARLPQVRAVLRKSTRNPYAPEWIPAASRDSLIRRSIISMPVLQDYYNPRPTSNDPLWPAARGLTRPNRVPLHRMKSLPPIIEKSTNGSKFHTRSCSNRMLPAPTPQSEVKADQGVDGMAAFQTAYLPMVYPIESSRPQIFFGAQQRNYSSETRAGDAHNEPKGFPVKEEALGFDDPRPHNNIITRAARQRSFSLHSQTSGYAPHKRLPSPPPNIPRWSTVQTLHDDLGDRFMSSSLGSSASIDSSILDEEDNDVFSIEYTNYASTSTFSPFPIEYKRKSPVLHEDERKPWDWLNMESSVASSDHSPTPTIRPDLGIQNGPGKIQLLRSRNSGLSLSLADEHAPSRNELLVSYNNIKSNESPLNYHDWHLDAHEKGGKVTGKGTPSSSEWFLNSHGHFILDLDSRTPKSKRLSTSVLQGISGNQANSFNNGRVKRPSSIATSQPFKRDIAFPPHTRKASTSKNRSEVHKRSSLIRVACTAPVTTSPVPASTVKRCYDVQGHSSNMSTIPGLFASQSTGDIVSPRPPSRATFSPEINWSSCRTNNLKLDDRYYSATMSMYNLHNDHCKAEPGSVPSTPTRKPSQRRLSPLPFSRTELPANVGDLEWPLLTSPLSPSEEMEKIGASSESPEQKQDFMKTSPTDSQPPSFLFPFPQPPKPKEWHLPPVRTIKGPRAAPARSPSRKRSSPKRSSPSRNFARPLPQGRPAGLMAHAVALRRMNSETSVMDVGERKKYLMGGGESISEEEGGKKRDGRDSVF